MTPRERFQRIMQYQPVDRIPVMAVEDYYERPALERWYTEGLPQGVSPEVELGMDTQKLVPTNYGPIPGFGPRTIGEDGEYLIEIDYLGATVRRRKDHPSMYYGYIDHPVKGLADWREYSQRFIANHPERRPAEYHAKLAALDASTTPVGLCLFPFFFRLGFYALGMERFMTAVYDEPELIHAMFDFWSDFTLQLITPALETVKVDYAVFGEDLAYKGGTHFSPAIYREFWLPYQTRVVEALHRHGVPIICMWSAGNIEELLPLLLDNGFNCTWPLERASNMDPLTLRKTFGRELRMAGGVPKEALIEGPAAIDRELARLMPLIEEGGYIPTLDDIVPPEVPWATYRYYIERLQSISFAKEVAL